MPKKAIPVQELLPLNLLPSMNVFPKLHPTMSNVNLEELSQEIKAIILNLNADFQGRKITLHTLHDLMLAFKYDYLQLQEGFVPHVPPNALTDAIVQKYCENNLGIIEEMLTFLIQAYLELHALTLEVITVTPEQWMQQVQVVQVQNSDAEASQ
jgi:hypothetical protein